jgi:hypothetical protein
MTPNGIARKMKPIELQEGILGSAVVGYCILKLVIRKGRMRKHKKKLYKQIHGMMLFAKATDEFCRLLYAYG